VQINGVEVTEGEIIALVNGKLSAKGHSPNQVSQLALKSMGTDEAEIITIYFGEDTTEREAQALASQLEDEYPDQEIEVINGGQPHYYYILSAE
jgi:dihydroxyacetone kinase-like predicted kinase